MAYLLPKMRAIFLACPILFLLNATQTAMAETTSNPMATDATTLVQNTEARKDSRSASDPISEARKKVAEIEADSEKAESWSNFWAIIGVIAAIAAGVGTAAAYWQASKENQINERLRKADQSLAALEMESQKTATAAATREAVKANEGLEKAKLDIEDRKKENSELRQRVATAETARLAMEQSLEVTRQQTVESLATANQAQIVAYQNEMKRSLASEDLWPREISPHREPEIIEALSKYAGTKFFVVAIDDAEPARVGRMIERLLLKAKWERLEPLRKVEETDGISFPDEIQLQVDRWAEESARGPAVWTLHRVLRDSGIRASPSNHMPLSRPVSGEERYSPESIPRDAMRIVVGLRQAGNIRLDKLNRESERDELRALSAQHNVENGDSGTSESKPANDTKPE